MRTCAGYDAAAASTAAAAACCVEVLLRRPPAAEPETRDFLAEEGAFSGSICCLAFSWPDAEGNSALAVVDGQESRILSIWEGFDASPTPFERKLCDAVASEGEVLSAHFLPESANQLVLTGKGPETGEVGLWSFQRDDGEEEGGGLEKKQARRI